LEDDGLSVLVAHQFTELYGHNQYAQQNLKPRTITRYRIAIETHLIPAFSKVKLHKLTALQIETVYARKQADGLSASSIALLHAVLSSAMKRAVRLSLVQTNVCRDVQTPRIRRDEVQVFDPSEVSAILSAASPNPLRALWMLALSTGARECELLALQVQDYNSEQGTLAIRRTVYNGLIGTPKSRNGIRTIKLPRQAQQALDEHIKAYEPTTYIFTSSTGNTFNASHFINRYWKPLLKRAGVEYRTFHTCRHTVASTLLSKGLPIPAVAAYLGNTPQILLSTYAHCLPNQMDAVADALDSTLGTL
jgi:integrase